MGGNVGHPVDGVFDADVIALEVFGNAGGQSAFGHFLQDGGLGVDRADGFVQHGVDTVHDTAPIAHIAFYLGAALQVALP